MLMSRESSFGVVGYKSEEKTSYYKSLDDDSEVNHELELKH